MKKRAAGILSEALQLTESGRTDLAGMIRESSEPPPNADIEAVWRLEIERRMHELDSGVVQPIPWEQVRARLYRRLGGG